MRVESKSFLVELPVPSALWFRNLLPSKNIKQTGFNKQAMNTKVGSQHRNKQTEEKKSLFVFS